MQRLGEPEYRVCLEDGIEKDYDGHLPRSAPVLDDVLQERDEHERCQHDKNRVENERGIQANHPSDETLDERKHGRKIDQPPFKSHPGQETILRDDPVIIRVVSRYPVDERGDLDREKAVHPVNVRVHDGPSSKQETDDEHPDRASQREGTVCLHGTSIQG